MASTFAGFSLYNSGPHRFWIDAVGRHFIGPDAGVNSQPTTWDRNKAEITVRQRGRLIAATDTALWVLVDAIKSNAELPRLGTLVDHRGRSWTNMTLLRFDPDDRIDRGRVVSLAYECLYRNIL